MRIASLLSLFLIIGIVGVLCAPLSAVAYGTTAKTKQIDELEDSIKEQDAKLKELEEKEEELEGQIEKAQQTERSLERQIDVYQGQIQVLENDLDSTEQRIELTFLEIEKKQLEIDEAQRRILAEQRSLGALLQRMDEHDSISYLELLLGVNSFSDFFSRFEQIDLIRQQSRETIQQVADLQLSLADEERSLIEKKSELDHLKSEQVDDQLRLESTKENKEYALVVTEANKEKYKDMIEDVEALKQEVLNERATMKRRLLAALASVGNKVPTSSGVFAWPTNTRRITAYYQDPSYYAYFGRHHYGLDIDGETGDPIMAVDNGVVAVAGWGRYYGNYVDILHEGNIVTRYAHMSSLAVSQGQVLLKGDTIGAMGSTGFSTGSHLHFEVRTGVQVGVNTGWPVDPLGYL